MFTARDKNGNRIPVIDNDGKKNTVGFCPCCGKSLIPRVGNGVRSPHWAHCHAERCDEWWEPESEWHIKWRTDFSKSNNIISVDIENVLEKNNEKHFYDIRIDEKISLILRRARLSSEQLQLRENFFGNMAWIVEAKVSEYNRLRRQLRTLDLQKIDLNKIDCYRCQFAGESFFCRWQDCSMPVVFDFSAAAKSNEETNDPNVDDLWIVLPKSENSMRFVVRLQKQDFIKRLHEHGMMFLKPYTEVIKILQDKPLLNINGTNKQENLSNINLCTKELYGGHQELADYWNRKHNHY